MRPPEIDFPGNIQRRTVAFGYSGAAAIGAGRQRLFLPAGVEGAAELRQAVGPRDLRLRPGLPRPGLGLPYARILALCFVD
ncbi:hypothetical protein AWH63_22270 [Marinobacter sp. C18]|mgnify:CR=1 FL=1|jgi:hypothetical protein|nr:hypothetical protein [Marinobacter sp. C18]OLF82952.1 hypothetical protein AWH63_22270 [Marinobacter sp. C18]